MNLNPDDPRLTAYALGELEPTERAAIEAELQQAPELRAALEEIRQTAAGLREELAAEPCPELRLANRPLIRPSGTCSPGGAEGGKNRANPKEGSDDAVFSLAPIGGEGRGEGAATSSVDGSKSNQPPAANEPDNVIHLPRWRFIRSTAFAAAAAAIMAVFAWQFWFAPKNDSSRQIAKVTPVQVAPPATTTTPAPVATVPPPPKPQPVNANPSPAAPVAPVIKEASQPVAPVQVAVDNTADRQTEALKFGGQPAEVAPIDKITTELPILPTETPAPTTVVDLTKLGARTELDLAREKTKDTTPPLATKIPVDQMVVINSANPISTAVAPGATGDNSSLSGTTVSRIAMRNQNLPASGAVFGGGGVTAQEAPALSWSQNAAAATRGAGGGMGGGGGGRGGGGGGRFGPNGATTPSRSYDGSTLPPQVYYNSQVYRYVNPPDTATYPQLTENTFNAVAQHPLSTFSIDVDTASYANVRRFLTAGQLPPHDAVRIEEMVNYFSYDYPKPRGEDPFSADIEVAGCPWNSEHRLVRIGLKGREIASNKRAAGNFVFLIDVSGSMEPAERLPLIKQAMRQLVKKMNTTDRVAIVVYASEAGVKLPSTSCAEKEKILEAIDSLRAAGGTNGGDGIQQAYQVARENFINGGVNRVLLCTDGDFNVGVTDQNQLVRMIEDKAKSGVFLTTLGVGTDNYKDALMQKLADKGNGNYYYLDTLEEAQKVLLDQMNGTLVTIAKDVKIQIEFNPAQVSEYRLVGYEKRKLRAQDFNNDAKDAGEIGAGHTITALYEIVPQGSEFHGAVDPLKYQSPPAAAKPERYVERSNSKELLTLKLRYKQPEGDTSRLMEFAVTDGGAGFERASKDFKFAAAVASFGMLLQDSEFKGGATYGSVRELAQSAKGADESGYRAEFLNLVSKAESLSAGR